MVANTLALPNPTKTSARERPIIFSGPMVQAVLAGRKTQTRRVVKGAPLWDTAPVEFSNSPGWWTDREDHDSRRCPYGKPGDRLWVRETFAAPWGKDYELPGGVPAVFYRADGEPFNDDGRWTPSIHMPRWASRITLELTGVRVERLQDISEKDAKAEGIEEPSPAHGAWCDPNLGREGHWSYRLTFSLLWDSINGKRAPWASNCWVWVLQFRVVK